MSDWRLSRVATAVAIVVFLAVQLAIPISRFGDEGARRFGWQMFSSAGQEPHFVVTTSTEELEIDLEDYMAMIRVDVDIAGLMPEHLCSVIPEAIEVDWEDGHHQC